MFTDSEDINLKQTSFFETTPGWQCSLLSNLRTNYVFKDAGQKGETELHFYSAGGLSSSQNSWRRCPHSIFSQCDFTETWACVNQEWLRWSNSFTNTKQLKEEEHAATFRKKTKPPPKKETKKTTKKMPHNQKSFNGNRIWTCIPSSYT